MTSLRPAAVAALLSVLALTSCSTASPVRETASVTSATAAQSTPNTTPVPKATTAHADATVTCENIVTPGTVDALKSAGWTSQEQELRIGAVVVDGGLLCLWADFDVPSDHGQMYGWGPIDKKTAQAAMAGLSRDGWLKSSSRDSVYFTEDPSYALETDDDGFGMTYEFGDGWVRFADTKQGLLLIEGTR